MPVLLITCDECCEKHTETVVSLSIRKREQPFSLVRDQARFHGEPGGGQQQ